MIQRVTNSFMPSFDELPDSLPIFPLPNALLTPRGKLPLVIFETRYLAMINDVMMTNRLIGMIQPKPQLNSERKNDPPSIYEIGCAGRITAYSETDDGRLEIVLTGISRFSVKTELQTITPYRIVQPEWSTFKKDFDEITDPEPATYKDFMAALRVYLEGHKMPVDWDLFEKLDADTLVSSLTNVLPIATNERQLLLEADTLEGRVRAFTAILNGTISGDTSGSQTRH